MKILRENLLTEHDWKQPNDDSRIARIQLLSIQEKVQELLDNIQDGDQLDAWIQKKITLAEDGLSSIRDYIVYDKAAAPGPDADGEISDELPNKPEIVTDTPPMDIDPESPVPFEPPIDSEDELSMDDVTGPGPEISGNIFSKDDLAQFGDDEDFSLEDEGDFIDDEEIDQNGSMEPASNIPLDTEEDMIEEEDDDYIMESLDSFSKKLK